MELDCGLNGVKGVISKLLVVMLLGIFAVSSTTYASADTQRTPSRQKNNLFLMSKVLDVKMPSAVNVQKVNAFPVMVEQNGQNVTVTAYVSIRGNAADMKNGNTTYRQSVIDGIVEHWSGTYGDKTVSVQVFEVTEEKLSYTPCVSIEIKNEAGAARVQRDRGDWTRTNVGDMTLFTSFENGKERTAAQFNWSAAHEFGHVIGLRDAVEGDVAPVNDMMRKQGGITSIEDILLVLEAHRTDRKQEWLKK